jgi:hypothetical protein
LEEAEICGKRLYYTEPYRRAGAIELDSDGEVNDAYLNGRPNDEI